MRYDWLLKITNTTAIESCAADQSDWIVYIALPSPTSATTGRAGWAGFTPSEAGRPRPGPPPRGPQRPRRPRPRRRPRPPGPDGGGAAPVDVWPAPAPAPAPPRADGR